VLPDLPRTRPCGKKTRDRQGGFDQEKEKAMPPSRRERFEALLAETPNDPELRYAVAMEYVSEGDEETGARLLKELTQSQPDYIPAYLQGGQVLARLDQVDEAQAIYRAGIAAAQKKGDLHAAGEMQQFLDILSSPQAAASATGRGGAEALRPIKHPGGLAPYRFKRDWRVAWNYER
jgi:thioredoxin-like negative regulator of GroEL